MTAFTDEDLKRLKFHVTGNRKDAFADGIYCRELEALLARLEAAETVVSEVERAQRHGNVSNDFIEPMDAWHKSAGKGR